MTSLSYQDAGVHVEQGDRFASGLKNIARRPQHEKMLKGAGGYAAVYPITPNHLIALTTDGVGTKVLLAHHYQQHRHVGIDLVAMCANDLLCVGARPTLFLDYFATGSLDLNMGNQLIEGIVDGCDQAGMILVGGETAEMPDVYQASQYDLAGFAIGELSPENLITGDAIQPEQVLIGVASSGIHSNGLSLARKVLTAEVEHQLLLEPTLIYVKPVLAALTEFPKAISGICHITGGGIRNLFRLNPNVGFELSDPLPHLPVFELLLSKGISLKEAYHTFNMGMGLALTVHPDKAANIITLLNSAGLTAQRVGKVTAEGGIIHLVPHQLIFTQKGKE